jgi:hypothetical protein
MGSVAADPIPGKLFWQVGSLDLKTGSLQLDESREALYKEGYEIWRNANFDGVCLLIKKGNQGVSYIRFNEDTKESLAFNCSGRIEWYFPEKEIVVTSKTKFNPKSKYKDTFGINETIYGTYNLKTQAYKEVLGTSNVLGDSGIDPSYTYTGASMNYINKKGELVSLDLETGVEEIIMEMSVFLKEHEKARFIVLGPRSPDRRYVPIQVERELYLINTREKKIEHITGKDFGMFGVGVETPGMWDESSRYLVYMANYDWFWWVYDHDVYYYDVKTRVKHRMDTGSRNNSGFWYSWE